MLFNNHPHLYSASLVDVSDVAEEVGKDQNGYYTISKGNCQVNGKWLAMPMAIIGAMNAYRKSAFAEVGYSKFPETWDQYRDAGKKLKAKGMPIGQPDQAQASFASTAPAGDFKFSSQEKLQGARSNGLSVASSSSLYTGRLDYY